MEIDIEYDCRGEIKDVDNFKRELRRQGLATDELDDFIENYMRWDNK